MQRREDRERLAVGIGLALLELLDETEQALTELLAVRG